MTIYLIFFWLVALCALLMELKLTPRARFALFMLSYLFLVVLVGLRWETGNDWAEYFIYYTHSTSLHDNPHFADTFEIGYKLFNICLRFIGLPYSGFLLIYSATYLGVMFLSFRRENYEISGWLALQLYAPFLIGLMGTSRQVMAIAICMFSVRYLLSRDWRKFLLCIGLATAFHISAPVFLLAWPVARIRLNLSRVAAVLAILAVLSMLNVGNLVSQYGGELIGKLNVPELASHYELDQESSQRQFVSAVGNRTVWTIVVRVSTLLLFLLSYRLFSTESDQLYFKLYLVSFCFVFLLSGAIFVLAERASIYFGIFQMHLLAIPTRRLKRPVLRKAYCVFLLMICLSRLYTSIYLIYPKIFVPYKGVLINTDVKRDLGWFKNGF